MRAKQGVLLDTARHVQAFLDENGVVIGPSIQSARRNLDDAVVQCTALSVTQQGGSIASQGATARQKAARAALRTNNMRPIATLARFLLSGVPEFQALTMPTRRLGATQLVSAASAMADAAEANAAALIDAGLPTDFVGRLRTAAAAVTASLDVRKEHAAAALGATSGLSAQEKRLRNLFKVIDALVVPMLGGDAVLLAKWKATRAITRRKPIVPSPSPVPPADASTATTSGTAAPVQHAGGVAA
jgi:hypothetical protein